MKNNKEIKEELNKFKEACLRKADELSGKYPTKDFSSWDVIANVLSETSGYPVYFFTLMADLDVIKLIAEGLSASSIANRLSISSQSIYSIANTWGLNVLDYTLDFNPMYIYQENMSANDVCIAINDILPIPITINDAKIIINNIEKYYELRDFMEELENEKG
jgi:hypothetical protein